VWLAPVQAIALPISDRHLDAAQATADRLGADGIRVEIDERTESIGRKIRDAELQKIPYMLIIGDKEAQDGKVALRRHGDGDQGTVGVDELAARLAAESVPAA
jgi:threonyl-tRNA synthetase